MEESGTQAKPFDNFDVKITLGNVSRQQNVFLSTNNWLKKTKSVRKYSKTTREPIYTKMFLKN